MVRRPEAILLASACLAAGCVSFTDQRDSSSSSYAWLEERTSAAVRAWVHTENSKTMSLITCDPRYEDLLDRANASWANNPPRRYSIQDGYVYFLVQNADHPRGQLRRAAVANYFGGRTSELVLDVDQLSGREGVQWFAMLPNARDFSPDGSRLLINLAPTGGIRFVSRELDLSTKAFVEGGFNVEQVGGTPSWIDRDHILVTRPDPDSSDLLELGRGRDISSARILFSSSEPGGAGAYVLHIAGHRVVLVAEARNGAEVHFWSLVDNAQARELPLPPNFTFWGVAESQLVFTVNADATVQGRDFSAGSLVGIELNFADGDIEAADLILEGRPKEPLIDVRVAGSAILVASLRDVAIHLQSFQRISDGWLRTELPFPSFGSVELQGDAAASVVYIAYQSFSQRLTTYSVDMQTLEILPVGAATPDMRVLTEQRFATSRDGTRVPYFVVRNASTQYDGTAPTLMHAYGAYGARELPHYSQSLLDLWVLRGGVYVVPNIRGGGEYGEDWHVKRASRVHTYDDFFAVAEDIVQNRISSPPHLGVMGASAGGTLTAIALDSRPDLLNAGVIQVAALDLFRQDLGRVGEDGQSLEWGSPDIRDERALLVRTSPFQNARKVRDWPRLILTASDDATVFPAQSRRYAQRLHDLGRPYLFYETAEGGHGMAYTPQDRARLDALIFTYLEQRLRSTSEGQACPS